MIVSIVGLGYIGLPTAAVLASKDIKVVGVDVNQYVVDNNEDFYIIKSVDSEKICNEIREAGLDFTS